jgi:alkanesulfonate monooxygenase SsuD/methylene tetrahydromethanopterin reductase-like flavin-dependent oxidoreductase (luciferase family)
MVERLGLVETLGFDWVSVAEHHYSPHRLTPAPTVSAAYLAACSRRIKIAVLGPIVSQSNPVQVAENFAMLDNMMPGRLVVGLLRGVTGEYLTYGLTAGSARAHHRGDRTDPQSLDRAASLRLAGSPFPVPHGLGVAAPDAAAAPADLRPWRQP